MSRFCIILLVLFSIVVHCFVPGVVKHGRLNPTRLHGRRKKVNDDSLAVVPESGIFSKTLSQTHNLPIRNTIVFDIDDTLCRGYKPLNSTMKLIHACNIPHYFYPNWKVVFDYLLKHNCFIDIYSSGVDYRNEPLMKDFLIDLYGEVKYKELLKEGQFKVYSRHHKNGLYCKTLAPTLRVNQTLDNIILVDDFILEHSADSEPESILVDFNFKHNVVTGLLGMFMTYFENKPQNETLRGFVGRVMPLINDKLLSAETEKQYINKGLEEIRKIDPDAPYYDETNT